MIEQLGPLGVGGPLAGLIVLAYVLRPAVLAALEAFGRRYQSAVNERRDMLSRLDAMDERLQQEQQGHAECLILVGELRAEIERLKRRQDRVEQRVSDSWPTSRPSE